MDERATGQPIRFEHYRVSTDEQGRPLKLGEGAMGVTYLAEDTNLKVRVALKVIRPQLLGDAEVGQRFQREAQAAARLRHPNVAGVYHLGMVDNTFFYAMEFVEGETVKDRVQRNGPLPLKEALEVALQVCEALGAAEKHKMVHRDIKPANIMLEAIEDDLLRVKLIDFGLAKPLHAEAQNSMALQTQAGIFLGTPVFASPEQIQDVPPDSRADFYSLGLTLWYMLEGRTPFEGSLHKVLFDQVHTAPPLGRLLWVPAEIRDLLGKMLEKDPVNRPQTARELRQKIHDCLRALATSGTSYTEWQQRFQVEGKPRSQPWGMIYEGQDTLSGAVRLHLLRNDRFSDPKAIQGVLGDARRAIDIHHPNILRHLTVFPTSGAQGTGWMVVTEHPGTQTLLDHLRKVKQLPPAEAIAIIERLASAIDTCIANDLITADLDPAGIFLKQVPRTEIHALTQTATATTTASVLSASTSETFEVVPKLSPINYSYLTTLRPADETAIGMTQGPFRAEATTPQELVQRLALLAYQCLGGAVGGAWSRVPRFIPLASLTQKQNDTLRTALVDSTWMRATDFVEAFQQTKTTRRTDETSRVSTSTEATVMLTSWRMLADLAAEDASGFSTEQAKEFTGKIEKQEAAPIAAPEEPATSQEEVAELPRTESESIQETEESPAADAAENVSHDTASVLDSTLTTERTQTWGRTEEPSESPAAETTETIAESTIETPPVDLKQPSPDETETLILSTGVNELLVTAAPPEIKEGADTIAQSSAESVADQPAAAESGEKTEPEESLTREDAGVEEVAAPAHLTTSSATAEAPAANTPPAEPAAAEVEVQGTSPQTETHAHASATSSPEMAQEQPPAPSTPEAPGKTEPFAGSSTTQSITTSSSLRPLAPLPTSSPKPAASTATSAVPLPRQAQPSQAKSPSATGTFGDRVKSLPRWVLPAAAALAALILIAGIVSLMSDDVDDPVITEDPIDVPPQPPTPPTPPPPAHPTISELLATASASATAGDLAKLDETLAKTR
ncbi:MAG TPA: protein kinase, partial [Candidatus Saccharimonadia bacterium]|nr:protein kinase [Candidatus Saccharimonadia bacterium]